MTGLRVKQIELSDKAAANILETAVNAGPTHGLGYWAELVKLREDRIDGDRAIVAIHLRDWEETPMFRSTPAPDPHLPAFEKIIRLDDVREGIAKILNDPEGCEALGTAERIMSSEYPDGPLAEEILQVVCFGKVIYA